jgi:transcriptional regulator with XRE-family HTH domain
MASTYGERLQQALTHSQKTVAELARQLVGPDGTRGISASSVHQVLRGQTKAHTAENCVRAARFLRVDPFWLATGQGAMLEQQHASPTVQEPPAPYRGSTADALGALRQLLQALPPDLRSTAADILSGWARSGGEDDRAPVLLSLAAIQVKRQA